ncbi:tRNA (N6-threonylcarbamoyladenosine(37)-N6)-methyltransferase TrmO [Desulfogranum mediterraneum]|uniref:tRNA (N6-threonylcarbamoyladenosine(37)-N6)-methyltransferase TrmO n=1 Tax=Desulfogranum mediterraneum TaxID=160661 RepID=UPI00041267AD|nr:tRNA (N6-threonylcarbamoyladenosine(37)-N6)-methyltransferase TrmO [Desulfogranum mediterraneum]
MLTIEPIGTIHSPIDTPENAPIQPRGAEGLQGEIEIFPRFSAGLADLEGFSHLYLIYHFHLAKRTSLEVTPFMDTSQRGVFATRSPLRPSHIGLSIVRLLGIRDNILTIQGIDTVDQTPLLDIKPYIENFDLVKESRSGWMQAGPEEVAARRSDDRFL